MKISFTEKELETVAEKISEIRETLDELSVEGETAVAKISNLNFSMFFVLSPIAPAFAKLVKYEHEYGANSYFCKALCEICKYIAQRE